MAYEGPEWGNKYTVAQLLQPIELRSINQHSEDWCSHSNETVMRHNRDGLLRQLNGTSPLQTKRGWAIVRYGLLDEIKRDKNRLKTKCSSLKAICSTILNKNYVINGTAYETIDVYVDEKLKAIENKESHIKLNEIINDIREAIKAVHYSS